MRHLGVLLVDPDRKEREKNARVLSEARYTVYQASACGEAAETLKRHRGRLVVISELNAGRDCGLRFLSETLKKYPYIPFTFLSTSPPLESVIEALQQGAYDILRKPIAPDILCHSVARSTQKLNLMLETEKQEKEIRQLLSRSREELKAARTQSSFKGFMISMAAHDFRTIITVLDGYLQFLNERCQECSVSEPSGVLTQAQRTIGRLRTMANTLLDYEAAEKGHILVETKPFSLREVLRECVEFHRRYAEQKEVDLSMEEVGQDLVVLADREKVMEILDNLLYNALKFTPACGKILLTGRMEEGIATVCVRDSGVGIHKERLKNIFEQAGIAPTLDAEARIGLGLAICKRLLEAQNGKIWIESTLGKGTQVYFSLPAA